MTLSAPSQPVRVAALYRFARLDAFETLRAPLLERIGSTALRDAELLNPPGGTSQLRFLAFRHEKAAALQAALIEQDIVTDVRGGVLRIGFGLYQTTRDVEELLGVLSRL